MNFYFRWLLQTFVCGLIILSSNAYGISGSGHVDRLYYLGSSNSLKISGWAASDSPNIYVTNIIVNLDGREIYRGRMLRSERPDVVQATGRGDWLASGFSVEITLPKPISLGTHEVDVAARLGSGKEIKLPAAENERSINITQENSPSIGRELAILFALLLPFTILLGSNKIQWLVEKYNYSGFGKNFTRRFFSISFIFSFILLVAAGSTGSSISLLFDHSGVASHDTQLWLGNTRAIRSDEWEVITPMAISQSNQLPRFPIVNSSWGSSGHNMLIVGMSGVPVAHISAIAKPATWGFFFLDMRKALAWYWWFPLFGCFGVLWLVLQHFFSLNWKISAGLAASFALSPYAAGFSGWPAYTAFFPLAALLFLKFSLQTNRAFYSTLHGVMLGICIAGFALVLYPAWQISLAYLFILFFPIWCWTYRRHLNFRWPQLITVFVAMGVMVVILGWWWLDTHEIIQSMRETIYPGQRALEAGGDIDRWYFIKGLLSIQTMYLPTPLMDASDASSFIFMPIAILTATASLIFTRAHRAPTTTAISLLFFSGALIFYMFIGSGGLHLPFWGMVTTYRLDLALGLTQIFFMAWLFSNPPAPESVLNRLRLIALIASITTFIWGSHLFHLIPINISSSLSEGVNFIALLLWAFVCYLVIAQKYAHATAIFCGWTLAISIPFNPLGIAPSHISLEKHLLSVLEQQKDEAKPIPLIAVIDERTWSLMLPIARQHVINSVFYYPPLKFWERIDPDKGAISVYNRYQRLFFKLGAISTSQDYTLYSPRLDEVVLTMDPVRFNFARLGASLLLSPSKYSTALSYNLHLDLLEKTEKWALYRVHSDFKEILHP